MLFLLLSWAQCSFFHCIPILALCKCPFTAQSHSIPVHTFIVYESPYSKRREILSVSRGELKFLSFPVWFLPTWAAGYIYMSKNPGFVFLPMMEGGLRQPAVMQHFHTACSVSSRWESSVSVYKMFLWSEIQLLVGLVPQWDLALCYQFWEHWISKAAFTGLLCTSWSRYLTLKSVKDMLLLFLGNQLFSFPFHLKHIDLFTHLFLYKNFCLIYSGQYFPQSWC